MARIAPAAVFVALTGLSAQAQPLATLDCIFDRSSVIEVEAGAPSARKDMRETLRMTFSGFDPDKRQALLIGNLGADEVTYLPGDDKIALIQITGTGNVSLTTIAKARADGMSFAVHTRHMWIGRTGVVSHMTGQCKTR